MTPTTKINIIIIINYLVKNVLCKNIEMQKKKTKMNKYKKANKTKKRVNIKKS